jgi:hypothetical protein
MKRWGILIAIQLAIVALMFWPDSYTGLRIVDILSLGTGFRAKEMCTCLFVLDRSDQACNDWTREISLNASYAIDRKHKTVSSSYQWLSASLPLFSSTAQFQDERRGCLLQR